MNYTLIAQNKKGGLIQKPQDLIFSLNFQPDQYSSLQVQGNESIFQIIVFAVLTLLIAYVTNIGLNKGNELLLQQQGMYEKYSLLFLLTQSGWDGFIFFSILQDALQKSLMLAPAALIFMMTLLNHFKLLISLWTPRFMNPQASQSENRNKLMRYIIFIYFSMLIIVLTLFYYFDQLWLLMLMHLNEIFQIVHTARVKRRSKKLSLFFFMSLATKPFYVVYCKAYPDNIFGLQPYYGFVIALCIVHYFLLMVIIAQQYYGSQFFIPKSFLPKEFQYEQKVCLDQLVDIACPICLTDFNQNDMENRVELKEDLLNQKISIFVTPCKHSFHPECLSEWLANKAECPTCRTSIPGLDL